MGLWVLLFGAVFAGIFISSHATHYSKEEPYSFMKESTSAPATTHHDYIVIGGGTAGCPLAATLAGGGNATTVLVLERGGSPYNDPRINDPRNFYVNLLDASPGSPVQVFVSEDGVINHRARVLGGGSAVNAGFYTRAGGDYVGRAGWDPGEVEQAYRWAEEAVASRPDVGEWQAAVRAGLLEAGVGPDNGFTYAEVYGNKIGGTIFDGGDRRRTAADFLRLADPAKIEVLLHATVQKILLRYNHGKSRPEAYGVRYKDRKGVVHTALLNENSKSEVILSAGAIASPQLLLLSGIGPTHHLQAHGIEVVLDQPMVGQGMADNPMNLLLVPSPIPVGVTLVQVVGYTKLGNYFEGISGINLIPSFTRSLSTDFQHLLNQTIEPLLTMARDEGSPEADHRTIKAGFVFQKVEGPLSTGHLELKTTNPDHNPSVTFNYYKEQVDLNKCIQGMKTLIDVVESEAFSKFKYKHVAVRDLINLIALAPLNLRRRHVDTAASLKQFCNDTVMSLWHYHGGCQVGRVVDSEYSVIGVDALRVVDAATFRGSPGANPQATIMMLGRYVGRRILKEKFGAY